MTWSWQEAQFFAALDGLGAAGGSKLVEGAGRVGLDGVFGDEKLRGYLAIAEAAGDQGEDFELACRDGEDRKQGTLFPMVLDDLRQGVSRQQSDMFDGFPRRDKPAHSLGEPCRLNPVG
jgi:hypothetical protein